MNPGYGMPGLSMHIEEVPADACVGETIVDVSYTLHVRVCKLKYVPPVKNGEQVTVPEN